MKERFIQWYPHKKSKKSLEVVQEVIADYDSMDIRLTLRQVYYQLVSKVIIPNEESEYKKLGKLISNARLAGIIDWDAIEDRGRQPRRVTQFPNVQSLINNAIGWYRLPRWHNQSNYVEMWCEKDALTSVIEPITEDLHVTFMANRGYSSSSAMYESSKRITMRSEGRPATIFYLGDLDPSGQDMFRDIKFRMNLFGCEVEVIKLAINPDQVKKYKIPSNPAKMNDSRAAQFIEEFGDKSYEVDAIDAREVQKLCRNAIEDKMDMDLYHEVIQKEDEHKEELEIATSSIGNSDSFKDDD